MKVLVAEKCGFCPGVRNAISTAEKVLAQVLRPACPAPAWRSRLGEGASRSGIAETSPAPYRRSSGQAQHGEQVYSLGPIIHNADEVARLARAGLRTVESIDEIESGTVIIRSHGISPGELAKLKAKGLKIVDATCVLVKRVQQIAAELESEGYEVVIIGEENHPEVQAVVGCVRDVVVIADQQDLHKLPKGAKLGIVCQTTQSPGHLGRMLGAIGQSDFSELKVVNTLCKEAVKRQQSAIELCQRVDVMFVLGGLHSGNTRRLVELCMQYNSETFHLQNWEELDKRKVSDKKVAGVTAGASTPDWVVNEFVEKLKAFG